MPCTRPTQNGLRCSTADALPYRELRHDQAARDFWAEWMAEEDPFLEQDRPWERADVIVAGVGATVPHDAEEEIVVAPPLAD